MKLTGNQRRSRLRLIRRRHRISLGLPLRQPSRRRDDSEIEGRDLDTPDEDLIGVSEDL